MQKFQAITADLQRAELDLSTLLSFSDKTLLFFYPKDNTPGCTNECRDFSALKEQFTEKGITLIGISRDGLDSHEKFITDHNLTIDLVSDPDLILHKKLGAYGEKNNYGKIVQGVIRSTFLIDKTGNVIQGWKNVRAKGHAERILKEV